MINFTLDRAKTDKPWSLIDSRSDPTTLRLEVRPYLTDTLKGSDT